MILIVASALALPGKRKEAVEHMKEIVAYRKKTYQHDVESLARLTSAAGLHNRLLFSTRYASLSAYDEARGKLREDKEWQALIQKGWDKFFDEASFSQTIFEVL
jgi:hypothetical protein